jgi:DNA gyrase/topoisomerase IV subunit A
MKPTIQIKSLMIKGGVKPKISQLYNSNHFMSNETTIPGSFVTETCAIQTEREFENIVTSRKNKAYDFSTVTMDNDYGHAPKGKHEFESDYDQYEHSLKTYDDRSKERLKNQLNNLIDNEYGYMQDRRDAELIRMKSKQEVAQKEKEIDNLKKLIFEKTKREMEYKGKLDKYKTDHAESTKSHSRRGSYASLNNSFKESNEKKIAQALSPYSSNRHSLRRSKRRTSSRVY